MHPSKRIIISFLLAAAVALATAGPVSAQIAPPITGVCRMFCDEPTCPPNSTFSNGQCLCFTGYWWLNGSCLPYDDWCRVTYGSDSRYVDGGCGCREGLAWKDGACISPDEWCRAAYGQGSYASGDKCFCGTGYFWNGTGCQSGAPSTTQAVPAPAPAPAPIAPRATQPSRQAAPSRKTQVPKKPPRTITDDELRIIIPFWGLAIGRDTPTMMDMLRTYLLERAGIPTKEQRAASSRAKRDAAEREFTEAARDGSIQDPEVRERIRKAYLDAWFDNPQDKKINRMLSILEQEKGNESTAAIFGQLANLSLKGKERDTYTAVVQRARESVADTLFREEAERGDIRRQLDQSSFMNQLRRNVEDEAAKAKYEADVVCRQFNVCDWAWMKTTSLQSQAERLSRTVRDAMQDPKKAIFGDSPDLKKAIDSLSSDGT